MRKYLITLLILFVTLNSIGCKHDKQIEKLESPEATVKAYISHIVNGRVLEAYKLVLMSYKKNQTIIDFWDNETRNGPFDFNEQFKITGIRYYKPPDQAVVFVKYKHKKQTNRFDLAKENGKWKLEIGGTL